MIETLSEENRALVERHAPMILAGAHWHFTDAALNRLLDAARASSPAPPGEGEEDEDAAKIVFKAMRWAIHQNRPQQMTPEWADRGNSLAQQEARDAVRAIRALSGPPTLGGGEKP